MLWDPVLSPQSISENESVYTKINTVETPFVSYRMYVWGGEGMVATIHE